MQQIRVLVIDDSVTIRAMMEEVFSRDRELRVVDVAGTAEAAKALVEEHWPHVVTLDLNMPGMDGMAFLDWLMQVHPVPVVMVSSMLHDDDDVAREVLAHGAAGYFDKAKLLSDAGRLVRLVKDAAHGKIQHAPKDEGA